MGTDKKGKIIVSATLESLSLMPDGTMQPTFTNIVYGEPDSNSDVYAPGCFDKSIKKHNSRFHLKNHKPKS